MDLSATQDAARVKLACQLQDILRRVLGEANTSIIDPDFANAAEIFVVFNEIEILAGRAIERIHTAFRDAKALEDWPEAKAILAEAIERSPSKIERLEKGAKDLTTKEQLQKNLIIGHGFDLESQEGQKLIEEIRNHRNGEAATGQFKDDPISQRIREEILKTNL